MPLHGGMTLDFRMGGYGANAQPFLGGIAHSSQRFDPFQINDHIGH
jgi:hypothetical protein